MFHRFTGALVRAALVAALILMPPIMLPDVAAASTELAIVFAAVAALFVMIEYGSTSPSFIEFRHAPPYNRLRFLLLATLTYITAMSFSAGSQSSRNSAIRQRLIR